MESEKYAGRAIGAMLLVQVLIGAFVNFVILQPMTAAPGFLVNAAPNAMMVSLGVVMELGAGALSVAMAIVAWPILRERARAMAMWIFALAVVGLSLNAAENTTILSMLSLSQEYAKVNPGDAAQFELIGKVVRTARYWAHYMKLMVTVAMFVLLYGAFFRLALIPRALAGFAGLATLLQLVAVTLPVFGQRINFQLIAPAGAAFLIVALWLIARGFRAPKGASNHVAAPEPGLA